jgi:ribosomal protein S18 acetylase RimI-like enzyme
MNNYCFDKLTENDLPIVLNIAKEIITNTYISFLEEHIVKNFIDSKQFENEFFDNFHNCTLLKLNNIIIGFSIIQENKIHLMMIDRNYQNQKHGMYLLRFMENKLFDEYLLIELQSFTGNTIANNFYEKNGWEKIEVINVNSLSFNKYNKKSKLKKADAAYT